MIIYVSDSEKEVCKLEDEATNQKTKNKLEINW